MSKKKNRNIKKYSSMEKVYIEANVSKKRFCNFHDEFMLRKAYPSSASFNDDLHIIDCVKHWENYFYIFKSYYEGNGLHLFCDSKHLYDFLISTEAKKALIFDTIISGLPTLHPYMSKYSELDRYIPSEDDEEILKEMRKDRFKEEFLEFNVFLYLHHHIENKPSNAFCITYSKRDDGFHITYITEVAGINVYPIFSGSSGIVKENHLFFNLVSYIEAFPDMLVEGTPEERKEYVKTCKNQNARSLRSEETLEENTEEKPEGERKTPHFRRGHFRRLSSKRYVNMKDKVIFVKSTMVKGRAKNVIDPVESISKEMQEENINSLCDELEKKLQAN